MFDGRMNIHVCAGSVQSARQNVAGPFVAPIISTKFRGYNKVNLVSANWELVHVKRSCL